MSGWSQSLGGGGIRCTVSFTDSARVPVGEEMDTRYQALLFPSCLPADSCFPPLPSPSGFRGLLSCIPILHPIWHLAAFSIWVLQLKKSTSLPIRPTGCIPSAGRILSPLHAPPSCTATESHLIYFGLCATLDPSTLLNATQRSTMAEAFPCCSAVWPLPLLLTRLGQVARSP